MILSHRHKFIFIHVYKNAGQSITTALLPFATHQNLINLNEKLQRHTSFTFLYPKPYKRNMKFNYYVSKFLNHLFRTPMRLFAIPPQPFDDHISAFQLKNKIGSNIFESYISFAVVRNPWDWQVSLYHYAKSNPFIGLNIKGFKTFDEYIHWRCTEDIHLQKDFLYSPEGKPLVNYVLRYENLESDFAKLTQLLGIQVSLPRINSSDHKQYHSYYSSETKELIQRTFAEDIKLFNYAF